jgi:hypothetical protein
MAVLDVWNKALSISRARGRLTSVDDPSPEQEELAQWYPSVLRTVQSAAWFAGCKSQARLALLSEAADVWTEGGPENGYSYAYALPANILRAWHLTSFARFSLSFNGTELILSTNEPEAILTYAVLQQDTTMWSPLEDSAITHALAAHITGPLTGKNSLAKHNLDLANQALFEAQAASANDMGDGAKPAVPWLKARGYGRTSPTRYYYPFGEAFVNAE